MTLERGLERSYRVRFDEAGPDGHLRSSGFMRYAQDLAWLHSESAGFDRPWYRERELTWLVRAIELSLLEDVGYGSEMSVSTQVTGFRRVWARRRSAFDPLGEERTLAVAITDWVLLNDGGRLVRPPSELTDAFGQATEFTPLRLSVPAVPPGAVGAEIAVRRSDLDPMAHVNNAAYLDYMDELYLAATGQQRLPLPRRYRAEFVYPAEPGSVLVAHSWHDGDAWWFALDAGDRPSFRASLEVSPASWVGG